MRGVGATGLTLLLEMQTLKHAAQEALGPGRCRQCPRLAGRQHGSSLREGPQGQIAPTTDPHGVHVELHGGAKGQSELTLLSMACARKTLSGSLQTGDRGFAIVHLTWSRKPEQPPWPKVDLLPTYLALESLLDHHEH